MFNLTNNTQLSAQKPSVTDQYCLEKFNHTKNTH